MAFSTTQPPMDALNTLGDMTEVDVDTDIGLSCPCQQYLPFGHHDSAHHRPLWKLQRLPDVQRPPIEPSPAVPLRPAPTAKGPSADGSHLDHLRYALQRAGRDALFTCGGTLPIEISSDEVLGPSSSTMRFQQQTTYPRPIQIYWNANNKVCERLSLPTDDDTMLQKLISACTPATFGRGGKDVYDEEYRKAGAIDTSNFCTTFCPYEAGIIDIITQLLLPPVVGDLQPGPKRTNLDIRFDLENDEVGQIDYAIQRAKYLKQRSFGQALKIIPTVFGALQMPIQDEQDLKTVLASMARLGISDDTADYDKLFALITERLRAKRDVQDEKRGVKTIRPNEHRRRMMCRGIRAELYKLNVYNGPSGHFKPHVDTPRSETQIGSLVVALPVHFEGGALAMRHQGEEIIYDWAKDAAEDSRPAIRWAAFYSDCEHEVLEVTAGHRVTLTYNLYLSPGTGFLSGQPSSLRPVQFPLYTRLQRALRSPDFMPASGYLGIFLAHSYPHTHPISHRFVPAMLKGVDMVLYESVRAAGLTGILEPVEGHRLIEPGVFERLELVRRSPWLVQEQDGPAHNLTGVDAVDGRMEGQDEQMDEETAAEIAADHGWTDFDDNPDNRRGDSMDHSLMEDGDENDNEADRSDWEYNRALDDPKLHTERLPDGFHKLLDQVTTRRRIEWLNNCGNEEMSRAWLAYGNQAELKIGYSSVALIVKVPSWAERSAEGTRGDPVVLDG